MKLAIFATQLPARSHTFIENELLCLEKGGWQVEPISLNSNIEKTLSSLVPYVLKENLFRVDYIISELPSVFKNLKKLSEIFFVHLKHQRGIKFFNYLYGALLLSYRLKQQNVQHLHLHFANAALNIGVLAGCLSGIPVSCTLHGPSDFEEPDFSFAKLLRRYLSKVRFISKYGRARFSSCEEFKHATLIHCSIDLKSCPYSIRKAQEKLKIVSVIRLVPQKNPLLIPKVAKILATHIDFSWDVIGKGELDASLKQEIKHEGIEDSVKILGPLPSELVFKKIAESQMSVLVSDDEGIPVFIMESMALGSLIVATNVGGVAEIVRDSSTGYLAPPASAELIASKIINAYKIMQNEDHVYRGIIQNARSYVEDEHDLEKNMKRFKEWIEREEDE